MPTSLATDKMSPELRARIAASVRGRRAAPGARLAPFSLGLLRATLIVSICGSLAWLFVVRERGQRELEAERAALLGRVRAASRELSVAEHAIGARTKHWLSRQVSSYEGDFVAGELRSADAFAAALARPTVYVRVPLASLSSAAGIEESAAGSSRDAFVLCLLDPPSVRSEKALLAKARAAYGGGERMQPAAHVQRLYHALVALPFLAPAWAERVEAAETRHDVDRLERTFSRVPLATAKLAAKAPLFLFAIDEADGTGPSELDGERAHHVRVGIVDLAADRLLLRLRRYVDPSWLSATARAEYASGIDACSLALDVRAAVGGTPLP